MTLHGIQPVKEAAAELIWPVTDKDSYKVQPWNIKRGIFAAGFSPNQKIVPNGTVARALMKYTFADLPEKEALYNYLMDCNRAAQTGHKANLSCASYWLSVYRAQELEKLGKLALFCKMPTTRQEWIEWRDKLHALYHEKSKSYGMSYKTISFLALLLWPLTCELVPVDTHVLARLNCPEKSTPQDRTRYMEIEQMVADERTQEGAQDVPLGIWHWLKWDEHLKQTGGSIGTEIESHRDLCCFDL